MMMLIGMMIFYNIDIEIDDHNDVVVDDDDIDKNGDVDVIY